MVGWLQSRRYGRVKPTLRRSGSILLRFAAVLSQGAAAVWTQRCQLPSGDGGAAMVHRRMLPRS